MSRRSCLSAGLVSMLGLAGKAWAQGARTAPALPAGLVAQSAQTQPRSASQGDAGAGHPTGSRVPASGRVIRVGPRGDVAAPSLAADIARDGDIIDIEAGEYRGDVAVWKQKRLSIRGVGGPVRMLADGKHAEGKAIWVLRDGDFEISGIEFEGARVPDRNGAGIRFERGKLFLRECRFSGNQNGLLTGNDAQSELYVDQCEFSGNGFGDGYTHNLYVGSIARCYIRASYFARAQVGQLLKCRARESRILYNRLTDELGGRASYEIDLSNGGKALLMGNLIVQQPATENSAIVTYGPEGYKWPVNELILVHNTIVNRRVAGSTFVRVYPGSVLALMQNNLFSGRGSLDGVVDGKGSGNAYVSEGEFRDPINYDFRLGARARSRVTAVELPKIGDVPLVPTEQYLHPMRTEPIPAGTKLSPGAFQT